MVRSARWRAGAILPVHSLLADRALVCEGTADGTCLRVAELSLTRLDEDDLERNPGRPIPKVTVISLPQEQAWTPDLPDARRCWRLRADIHGVPVSVGIVERGNGSLVIDTGTVTPTLGIGGLDATIAGRTLRPSMAFSAPPPALSLPWGSTPGVRTGCPRSPGGTWRSAWRGALPGAA
jgi:hypothetical protein